MTSYRIAAVAAVSSASACLFTLLYLPSPGNEPVSAGLEAEYAVPRAAEDVPVAAEAESADHR